ncbi:YkyA family protein [Bacillus sp. EB600]|uniref:YkyA family protein n=1 Tax=Bacillus sp. EB600 TaxID=2806345 RepID=UPI00210ABC60|nr:YkyA family protein [Bacillus sp. EB600]MCQ6279820.1 hypothetical protein [Bacillus sp. EB600]
MNRRIKIFPTCFILVVTCVLSACVHQETPADKIYTVLEKVATIETGFEEV